VLAAQLTAHAVYERAGLPEADIEHVMMAVRRSAAPQVRSDEAR
jgi:hypothetical protein